jgi:hypothetical protein
MLHERLYGLVYSGIDVLCLYFNNVTYMRDKWLRG